MTRIVSKTEIRKVPDEKQGFKTFLLSEKFGIHCQNITESLTMESFRLHAYVSGLTTKRLRRLMTH